MAAVFDSVWTKGYSLILDINNFIAKVSASDGVISDGKKEILLGEAYGLRAYIHLDMLRLFGPIYSLNPDNESIPYRTEAAAGVSHRLPASEVMDRILQDIDKAIVLLKNDPVISQGVMVGDDYLDDFYTHRNRRMNYYAASALKVRALMYKGDKAAAATLAAALLQPTAIPDKFPWTTKAQFEDLYTGDRICSSEVLFGIHSERMYDNFRKYFDPALMNDQQVVAPHKLNVTYLYGEPFSASTDFRALSLQIFSKNPEYICLVKFQRPLLQTDFMYFQPLIRKSELYLALAEANNDVVPLNVLLTSRGVLPLSESSGSEAISAEITKEFMREFIGEGQTFFYYKRTNMATIRSYKGANVAMSDLTYIVPLPLKEKEL